MNSGIILMAGKGIRSGLEYNKNLHKYWGKPLFIHSVDAFLNNELIDQVVLVIDPQDELTVKELLEDREVTIVYGGQMRTDSLKSALKNTSATKAIVHDAARPHITSHDITLIIEALDEYDLVTFYHPVVDTIKDGIKTLNRNNLKAVTTPQGFNSNCFEAILQNQSDVFDELQIFEESALKIGFIKEQHNNQKMTTEEDFVKPQYLIGHSRDFHKLVPQRKLLLGGVEFDSPVGLLGHSDADVVYHAVAEAIIGALGLGDLGTLYPDSDPQYHNIDSAYFLQDVCKILEEKNYQINNLDIIVYLETPNLKNHKRQMAENIARNLKIDASIINVKATTMEKCGVIGSNEGIASEAVVLLKYQ